MPTAACKVYKDADYSPHASELLFFIGGEDGDPEYALFTHVCANHIESRTLISSECNWIGHCIVCC